MKLRLIALAALAAAGSANALTITQIENYRASGALREVRLLGASAQTPMLESYIATDLCNSADYTKYV